MLVIKKKSNAYIYVVVLCALICIPSVYVSAQIISNSSELKSTKYFAATPTLAQVLLLPQGAPQTGYGGAQTLHKMNSKSWIPLLTAVLSLLLGCGLFYVVRDWMGFKGNGMSRR